MSKLMLASRMPQRFQVDYFTTGDQPVGNEALLFFTQYSRYSSRSIPGIPVNGIPTG
ncbi:MAG TPA: hypothetical protein VGQ39_08145 [Pyrinomonadaceae bacterium]|nr:hypothetical protein [Pyrinomonadaceae bacterium]